MRPITVTSYCLIGMLFACGEDQALVVSVVSPAPGASFDEGDNVQLVGEVFDPEGVTDVVAVEWLSDVDGSLAQVLPDAGGRVSAVAVLSVGAHRISLQAEDREGHVAGDSVSISVAGYPFASIDAPVQNARLAIGESVTLTGTVGDPLESPDALWATWEVQPAAGAAFELAAGPPDGAGVTSVSWEPADLGQHTLRLVVVDSDELSTTAQVTVEIMTPTNADRDGDGFSEALGDCDDNDPARHPEVAETCDGVDDDCDGTIDEKDTDGDRHVDRACTAYDGPAEPDDCDDARGEVFPGATELQNSTDDDCDGEVDEGTPAYDHDGDCFCPAAACADSVVPTCLAPAPGDCDDTRTDTWPGAPDLPGGTYDDTNCDGIDGEAALGVFLAPSGSDTADCLTPSGACASVGRVAQVMFAGAAPKRYLYLQAGTYEGSLTLDHDLTLLGGFDSVWDRHPYEQSSAWRSVVRGLPAASGPHATLAATGVEVGLQNVVVEGPAATGTVGLAGAPSYAVYAVDADVVVEHAELRGGVGATGGAGASGANFTGAAAPNGVTGFAAAVGTCATSPQAPTVTNSCGPLIVGQTSPASGAGGVGGGCSAGGPGASALATATHFGLGGAGGGRCDNGAAPVAGQPGVVENGAGGAGGTGGAYSGGTFVGGTGSPGLTGQHGGGGGGGGGSGGCRENLDGLDVAGAGGGSGGAGGCRSNAVGQGGGAGGAAIVLYASGGTVSLDHVAVLGGVGGVGGRGGDGGSGQPGGAGGDGGDGGVLRDGADGGPGGHGGHAGGGGGGRGGAAIGLLFEGATVTDVSPTTISAGTPGAGGPGGGSAVGSGFTDGISGQVGASGTWVDRVDR